MRQQGNVLFLILIAVALFAALSYAVTKSASGGGNVGAETLRLRASQILQHVALVEMTMQRMMLIGGVDSTQFQFNKGNNPNCTNDTCDLFAADGGGISYQDPENVWLDQAIKDNYSDYRIWEYYTMKVQDVGTTCATADCTDLVIMLEATDPALCAEINKQVGIAGVPTGEDFVPGGGHFIGTFHNAAIIGDATASLAGQRTACFLESDGTPSHIFYHVLLAR